MEKLPTPGNCQRLEVIRVNPEIFNSVRKEVKTEDVMLQKAQKPLLKGITAVAKVLSNFMKVEKDIEITSWKARAYGIFTRVGEVSEIERVSAANE